MTITILLNTSWNIYNFRLGLIKALQKEGHIIVAIAPYDEYVPLLKSEGVECYSVSLNSKGTNIKQDLKLTKDYFELLKAIKPDMVLSYTIKPNIYGNLAANILKIPVINNVSGLGTIFIKKSLSTLVALALYKIAFLKSGWVFFQNNEDQGIFLKKKLQRFNKTSVIPGSGVDLNQFDIIRQKNSGMSVLFVGRLIGDKGIREFIEAGKRLHIKYPDVEFKIVGEFGYDNKTAVQKEELEEWLKLPQFNYLGKSDNMNAVYEETDIMVLPSYREGLSRSLIEACAMKLPIVTTNVPGCKDVVQDGYNGYLCEPKNAIDLAEKIGKLLDASEENRLLLGANARKLAERRFDEKIVIDSYLERINNLASV
ncbi:glycosyltransferase family 4 protein [Salegentibacter chungangensis]|uniref:Glycosyltransferase family 4 protein n=1 Tax=Salegentibacter chungangensis TaxID=1335724 RepID=A0ABW3NN69_9FLAO